MVKKLRKTYNESLNLRRIRAHQLNRYGFMNFDSTSMLL
jgi:hypothetical protein